MKVSKVLCLVIVIAGVTNALATGTGESPWVDVKVFGAVGDGVTDDTNSIQQAINYIDVANHYGKNILFFPSGKYLVTSTLVMPANCRVVGSGMWDSVDHPLGAIILGKHTGAAVVSLVSKNYGQIENLIIRGDSTITPKTGLLLGRGSSASAGNHTIKNVVVDGYYSKAAIYSIASEGNTFMDIACSLSGGGAKYVFYTSQSDGLSVGGLTGSSNIVGRIYGFFFWNLANVANSSVIFMDAGQGTANWAFRDGYLATGNGSYITIPVGITDGGNCSGPIIFDNVNGEPSGGTPVKAYNIYGSGQSLNGLVITGGVLSTTASFINCNSVELNSAEITAVSPLKPSTFWRLKNSNINLGGQDITITSDAVNNIIRYTGTLTINGADTGNLLLSPNRVGISGRESVDKFLMLQKSWLCGTNAPVSGTWARGDIVWNSAPSADGNIGWICVTAGTPGTWRPWGEINP